MSAGALVSERYDYARQVQETRQYLDTFDDTSLVTLAQLEIGEVRALKQEVAEIFPASNLPSFLLHGLIQLEDRTLKQEKVAADLRVLFRGSKQIGIYGTFLAAPAMVLYGYQRLLALAGKDVESAFPNGPWQFYTQFGLREDAARHCAATTGFQRAIPDASEADAATCWVYAAIHTLFAYDDLLANEWHERVLFRTLHTLLEERALAMPGVQLPRKQADRDHAIADQVAALRKSYQLDQIESRWAAARPYSGPPNEPHGNYAAYRHARFCAYVDQALRYLPPDLRQELDRRFEERRMRDLPAYQQQMTLLRTLYAESYQERPTALAPHLLRVALIVGGRYYLIDACARNTQGDLLLVPADSTADRPSITLHLARAADGSHRDRYNRSITVDRRGGVRADGELLGFLRPPPIEVVKGQVEAILRNATGEHSSEPADTDLLLVQAPRERQRALRSLLLDNTQAELAMLRYAPIIVNWDRHNSALPLTELRCARRGCSDHALTLIRTEREMIFDMSHIFFDSIWGIALAEILTGVATSLYRPVAKARPVRAEAVPLRLAPTPAFLKEAQVAIASRPAEAAAETDAVDLNRMNRLRRRLARIELVLTVNDLLILARCIHAASYRPGPLAQRALEAIAALEGGERLNQQIMRHLEEQRTINPALLIPMDASAVDPRQRLFPATFRNPLADLLPRIERCAALARYLHQHYDDAIHQQFVQERQLLYRELRTFGALLRALRQVTMRGESFTMAALRLMGHLPGAMQNLVDMIPQKFGILNEILKGREVFSNVGQVVATSSLTRFASARDDGETKLLVWGIMTDATGRMVISLRDFRPHVAPLHRHGRPDLARWLAQDYLDAYAACVNNLVVQIQRVMAYK